MSKKKTLRPKIGLSKKGVSTEYRPEYCQMLINEMANGISMEAFAGIISITKKTLYEWFKEYPEFAEAKEIGIEKSRLFWEKLGITNIISESEKGFSRSINSAVWVFNMKNRFGWRDKQPDEADVVVNNVNNLSDSDLDAKIEKLISKLKNDKK